VGALCQESQESTCTGPLDAPSHPRSHSASTHPLRILLSRAQVRRALGHARLDRNAMLYEEASALSEILGDVRVSNDAEFHRRRALAGPSLALVESEIRALLGSLERLNTLAPAAAYGRTQEDGLLPLASRRKQTLLEAVASSTAGGRPMSARPGTGTPPSRPGTAASSRGSRPGSDAGSSSSAPVDPRGAPLIRRRGAAALRAQAPSQ
jgi:hypothetical protein